MDLLESLRRHIDEEIKSLSEKYSQDARFDEFFSKVSSYSNFLNDFTLVYKYIVCNFLRIGMDNTNQKNLNHSILRLYEDELRWMKTELTKLKETIQILPDELGVYSTDLKSITKIFSEQSAISTKNINEMWNQNINLKKIVCSKENTIQELSSKLSIVEVELKKTKITLAVRENNSKEESLQHIKEIENLAQNFGNERKKLKELLEKAKEDFKMEKMKIREKLEETEKELDSKKLETFMLKGKIKRNEEHTKLLKENAQKISIDFSESKKWIIDLLLQNKHDFLEEVNENINDLFEELNEQIFELKNENEQLEFEKSTLEKSLNDTINAYKRIKQMNNCK
eukprot:gene1915-1055_t